jgi:hypothetical protein
MHKQTPTQNASAEMAAAVWENPELRGRIQLMAKGGEARPFVCDDFAWLAPEAKPPD